MRAARAYGEVARHTAVISGNTLDLIILLYDKLLQRLREAQAAVAAGNIRGRGEATSKAIDIIEKGLVGSLDPARGGDIALRLKTHYQLWSTLLLKYNIQPDDNLLLTIETQVKSLKEGWEELKRLGVSSTASQQR